jgi:exosome complex component RRP45
MPREAEPSLNEKQFVLRALQENLRLDGRAFDQYRELELSFGDDYGVADVRLGRTRLVPTRVSLYFITYAKVMWQSTGQHLC